MKSCIKWVQKVKHLGNIIRCDLKEADEISQKRGDLIGRINNLLVTLPKAPDNVILKIFRSQYEHLYGCEAWDLTDSSVPQLYTVCLVCITVVKI